MSASAAEPLTLEVTQELNTAVRSIALTEGNRVAALGDEPYVRGAKGGFRALPLPKALLANAGQRDEDAIYFGRDYEPRIMGTRFTGTSETPIYWRHVGSGWRDGREEIGRLGSSSTGGLFGVLGTLDPELVCRARQQCIIKRNSGWLTVPAGAIYKRVLLEHGTLWGLDSAGIATIDQRGWAITIAAPSWSAPAAFWASAGEAWVSSEGFLFHYSAGAWQKLPPPIAVPAAFWGDRPDSVWVVGEGGAAHFDGHEWQRASLPGPLLAVAGRPDGELWFGGKNGLFRVAPGAPLGAGKAPTRAPAPEPAPSRP